jgi:hypothetical protein
MPQAIFEICSCLGNLIEKCLSKNQKYLRGVENSMNTEGTILANDEQFHNQVKVIMPDFLRWFFIPFHELIIRQSDHCVHGQITLPPN